MRTPSHYEIPHPLATLLRMDETPVYNPYRPC